MSLRTLVWTAALAGAALTPRTAQASDLYARLLAGPAYFHNDSESPTYDTSGLGIVSQLDLGARLGRSLALHASLVYDTSRWMSFDDELFVRNSDYETTVLGLGIGATSRWDRFELGAVLGAQFTTHPGGNDAPEGPDAAGLGPLLSVTAGYVLPRAFEGVDVGAHALARYRVGKDDGDPSGYQLGLGLSIALAGDGGDDRHTARRSESEAQRSESKARRSDGEAPLEPARSAQVGYASAQIGWWNAELEFLSNLGVYVAAGGPWALALYGAIDDRAYIPFGGRIGYQFDASASWKVRAAAHLVGWKEIDRVCEAACSSRVETWQFFELGARHESASGWVYGIDVPLLAIEDILGTRDRDTSDAELFAPPLSLIFTQVYVGYSWAI